ncbi:MAG: hypothetical protein K0S51_1881 [Bacillales bacterium]|jgi:hypothetical protein|nr:hypothetical protein [Bacillales bacterium]
MNKYNYSVFIILFCVFFQLDKVYANETTTPETPIETAPIETPSQPQLPLQKIVDQIGKYSYSEMQSDIQELQQRYPFLKVEVIGTTVEKRSIYKITLGESNTKVMLNGSHHGREWITTLLLMQMLEEYSQSYNDGTFLFGYQGKTLLDKVAISFIPMVNPDGVEIAQFGPTQNQKNFFYNIWKRNLNWNVWKANGVGIDPNSNYNYKWKPNPSYPRPGLMGWRGNYAEQAIETKSIANDVRKNKYAYTLAYHSSGRILFWYVNQKGLQYDRDLNSAKQISNITGYSLVSIGSSLNTAAGLTDWVSGTMKMQGNTIEVASSKYAGTQVPLIEYPNIWNQNRKTGFWAAYKIASEMVGPPVPKVYAFSNNDSIVKGKSILFGTVVAFKEDKVIGTAKADYNGNFTMKIPKQTNGTTVKFVTRNSYNMESRKRTVVVMDKIGPSAPTYKRISSASTVIEGQTEPNASVYVTLNNKILSNTKADVSGKYSLKMAKKPFGTKLTLYAVDVSKNKGKTAVITVVDPFNLTIPTVEKITTDTTTIVGKGVPNSTINVVVDRKIIATSVISNTGLISINIPKQKLGTIIEVYGKNKLGFRSRTAKIKVESPPVVTIQ